MRRLLAFLIALIFLILGMWLSWEHIASSVVRYALQSSVQKVFGANLQIANIHHQDNLWIVEKPLLSHPNGWQATVPQFTVSCSFQPLKGLIDLQIDIPQPEVAFYTSEITDTVPAYSPHSSTKLTHLDFLHVQSQIHIEDGRFQLEGDHPLLFQLYADTGSGHGEGTLWLDEPHTNTNCIHLVFDKSSTDFAAQLSCFQVDCHPLGLLLEKSLPQSLGVLQEGELNGILDLTAKTGKGSLNLVNALFLQSQTALFWQIPELEFSFNTATTGRFSLLQSAVCYFADAPEKILGLLFAGNLDFTLEEAEPLATLHVEGKAVSPELLSDVFGLPLGSMLVDHPLVFDALLMKEDHLEGRLQLVDPATDHREYVNVDMTFAPSQYRVKSKVSQGWKRLLALRNYSFEKGSFARKQFALAPWKSLLIDEDASLQGVIDFEGLFDANSLTVNYSSSQVRFENELASFEIDDGITVGSLLSGTHTFDLVQGTHEGHLCVDQASYLEKQSGLCFTDLSAAFTLLPGEMSTSDLTGFCNDCFLGGRLAIEMNDLSNIYVDLYADTFDGSLKQFQPIWGVLGLPDLFKNSLEGRLSTRHGGMHVHAELSPIGTDLQVTWEGILTEGSLLLPEANLALQEVGCRFDFDSRANALDFWDIHGKVKFGSPHHTEEYTLGGDHIRLTDLEQYRGEFDVWVADQSRDLLRLVGKTHRLQQQENENGPYIQVAIDPNLSHFGDLYPQNIELLLRGWHDVAYAKMELNSPFSSVIRTLQRFSSTGFLIFSRHLLKELKSVEELAGEITGQLEFSSEDALLTYQLHGKEIAFGKHRFQNCLLKGQLKDATWMIDELQLGALTGAASFHQGKDSWRLHFLGLKLGSSCLLGMEGDFYPATQSFIGKIPLCEIDLAQLPLLSATQIYPELKGVYHGSGEVALEGQKNRSGWKTAIDLHGSLRDIKLGSLSCTDSPAFDLSWKSDSSLILRDFCTTLRTIEDKPLSQEANLAIAKAEYHFPTRELLLNGVHLNMPSADLPRLQETMKLHLPSSFVESMQYLMNSFQEKTFDTKIDYSASPNHSTCHATLPPGVYRFGEYTPTLQSLVIDWDPIEMAATAILGAVDDDQVCKASIKIQLPYFSNCELVLAEMQSETIVPPLTVRWQSDAKGQPLLQELTGACCGICADLKKDREDTEQSTFYGQASIDFHKADPLLRAMTGKSGKDFGVSGKYEMEGIWSLPKLQFQGTLCSQNCWLGSYGVDQLTAKVQATPTSIVLNELTVNDQAGKLHAEQVNLIYPWQVTVPALVVEDFRPQALRSQDNPLHMKPDHSFVIRRLELNDLSGDLMNSSSWRGQGSAYCANPPKRDVSSMLWTFSDELLNKAGVGKMLLSPVSGQVDFSLQNRQVLFTGFKDMYSAGHASKFTLQKNSQTYVDFDGNLFVQLRMKQKNPLLRSVAPVTITIQGTLEKPIYSFRLDDKEEQ